MITISRSLFTGLSLLALGACNTTPLDWDLRGAVGGGLDTSNAALRPVEPRPQPDGQGLISYPGYQVAVARHGDTVRSVANRIGVDPGELARHNAVAPDIVLRSGEVLALPRRVAGGATPLGVTGAGSGAIVGGTIAPAPVDVTAIATTALDRAGSSGNERQTATQPGRHRVARGETAYSIARLYNVNVRALADWNGLDPDLTLREGQYLLIPVAAPAPAAPSSNTAPGQGTPTPVPPSAATPLPDEKTTPAAQAKKDNPASPNLGSQRSTSARFAMPVDGRIIREYAKGRNEGIDIGAAAGTAVRAAADGTVAAVTKDTNQVPIVVIRHADNLLTVYAGIDALKVAKGARVKRGQDIAVVRRANPAFLHFEVRKGVDSIDPMSMLQ